MRQASQNSILVKLALVAALSVFQAMSGIGAGVLNAQNVTGTVISATDNGPLIGAGVKVQGTTLGVVTDIDGNFAIDASVGQTLEISFLGYITQEVTIAEAGEKLFISLQEDQNSLDEVVIVGYGVQKKKLVTGANINV